MIRLILLRLCESFFRHMWLYFLPIVLMITLGVVYIMITPPKFLSWGTFYIQDESLLYSLNSVRERGFTFDTPSEVTVDEMNELFSSAAFMRAVAQQTNLEEKMSADRKTVEQTLEEMRNSIWAQSTGERMVFIGVAHEDAELAHQLAQSTMDTYTQWKINISQYESAEAQRFFAELLDEYRSELEPIRNSLTDYLISHPEPVRGERPALEVAEIDRIQAELQMSEERLANAENKEENARLALTQAESDVRQTYLIFDSPILSLEPMNSLTDMAVTFIVFLFIGLFLSVVGIVGGVFINRSILFPLDVRQAFDLPVLATVPELDQRSFDDALFYLPAPNFGREPSSSVSDLTDYDITIPIRIYKGADEKVNSERNGSTHQDSEHHDSLHADNGFRS